MRGCKGKKGIKEERKKEGMRQTRRDKGSRKTNAKELGLVNKAEVGLLDFGGDGKKVRHTVRGTAA